MKLEQQVCSLELAKKLKKLRVTQESLIWWKKIWTPHGKDQYELAHYHNFIKDGKNEGFSAFTTAELGEMLPTSIESDRTMDGGLLKITKGTFGKNDVQWQIMYYDENFENASTEADARAKMLIYLLQKKLLSHRPSSS